MFLFCVVGALRYQSGWLMKDRYFFCLTTDQGAGGRSGELQTKIAFEHSGTRVNTHTYMYKTTQTYTHTHAHLILFGLIWICLNGWCYNITAELFLQTECVITSFLFCTFRSDDLLWVICNSVSLRSVLHWDEVVRPPVKFMPCDRFPPSSLLDTRPPAAVKSSHVSHQGLLTPSCDHSSKTPRPLYTFL